MAKGYNVMGACGLQSIKEKQPKKLIYPKGISPPKVNDAAKEPKQP